MTVRRTAPDRETFRTLADRGNLIPLARRLMSDQLTPVLAYRRLVAPDARTAPSFLLESVETGGAVGRYSALGAQPALEVLARGHDVEVIDHRRASRETFETSDPLAVPRRLSEGWTLARPDDAPHPPLAGGWFGYAGYDTVRYLEPEKLPFDAAPRDDRTLADLHFGLYRDVAVFDHVEKIVYAIHHVLLDEHDSVDAAYDAGVAELDAYVERLSTPGAPLAPGTVDLDTSARPTAPPRSNFAHQPDFEAAVERCREYIAAGDIFQVVISQRFERDTTADPFDIYRALRIVNPSPYMIYLQSADAILVASSPEILCRVAGDVVVNRPLAGTRRRGGTEAEDRAHEADLRADAKECAEHVMLVDLGRNDVGRVCELGSIELPAIMEVERYSHVMHLSSTVTGRLHADRDAWDALRMTLPVGTVSGAPKVRAMQIIDELEPTRRGPYAGGIGAATFDGDLDIAIALRTMVIPTNRPRSDGAPWTVHLQAGAGIVLDSVPTKEYEETQHKAAALGRAIDLAETAFATDPPSIPGGAGG